MDNDIESAYDKCVAKGNVIAKDEVDLNKAKSLLDSAKNDLIISQELEKIKVETSSHLFKTYYDILRELADSFILFDKITVSSHFCLFAYLVMRHPELELDWNRLDTLRQLSNRISIQY